MRCLLIFFFIFLSFVSSLCPEGSHEWQSNCYLFRNVTAKFVNAELDCNQLGGHLASISDGWINAVIGGMPPFTDSTVANFWIGGTTLMKPPKWSWTDGADFSFTEWAPSEPSNLTTEACTAMSVTQPTWSAEECFKLKPYVCKIAKDLPVTSTTPPPFVKCPLGWIYFQPTKSCFGMTYDGTNSHIEGNWTYGQQHCHKFNASLPSVHSEDEMGVIYSFKLFAWVNVWVGLRSDDGITWRWSDNSTVDYLPWQSGYPKNISVSCVAITGMLFYNIDCNTSVWILCKKPAI